LTAHELDQRPVAHPAAGFQHGVVVDEPLTAAAVPSLEPRLDVVPEDGPAGLIAFALDNLARMELDGGLFCEELVAGDPFARGLNLRYSLMTCIGLHKASATGYVHRFDLERLHAALLDRLDAPQLRPGDFGLHLWADALTGGEHGDDLLRRLTRALDEGHLAACEGMEIGWIVQGLALQVAGGASAEARDALASTLDHAIARAHPGSGLFEHTGTGFRRRFPNFATEIYNVLALSTVASLGLDHDGRALAAARRAGERLLELQLPDGGWPWLYDARSGRVVERYEVYTVHQDAMAPMGLLQLAEATGDRAFVEAAGRGLNWIYGANELRRPMLDAGDQILCRSIRRRHPWSRLFLYGNTAAATVTGAGCALAGAGTVELYRSDRPYHLGWVLEAWCGREDVLAGSRA
jgi:hypothetical protein